MNKLFKIHIAVTSRPYYVVAPNYAEAEKRFVTSPTNVNYVILIKSIEFISDNIYVGESK